MSDEFMVVPVPPCFDPDAPLTADPSPVTVSITEYKQLTESQQGPFLFSDSNQVTLQTEIKSSGSASFIEQRSVSSIETTLEMTSRVTAEEENNIFDLANETIPLLSEPLIPQPVLETPIKMEASPTEMIPAEPYLPITVEPLPAPEPLHDDSHDDDDDDDGSDDDDDHNRNHNEPAVPEVSSQPIATQPLSGLDEPVPVALQPEPSTLVVTVPTTVPASEVLVVQRARHNSSSSDFAANVVSDVLSTAIDAAASAGRAVMTTVENLLNGGSNCKSQTTAMYNPEQGCEISVNPSPGADDTPIRVSPIALMSTKVWNVCQLLESKQTVWVMELECCTLSLYKG